MEACIDVAISDAQGSHSSGLFGAWKCRGRDCMCSDSGVLLLYNWASPPPIVCVLTDLSRNTSY